MFVGAGIEDHQRTGAETFDFADAVACKAGTRRIGARVRIFPISSRIARLLAQRVASSLAA